MKQNSSQSKSNSSRQRPELHPLDRSRGSVPPHRGGREELAAGDLLSEVGASQSRTVDPVCEVPWRGFCGAERPWLALLGCAVPRSFTWLEDEGGKGG